MSCCAECGHVIDLAKTNFNLPPWCPGCGADLKLVDRKPELRVPRRSSSVGGETPPNPWPEPEPVAVASEAFSMERTVASPSRRPKLPSDERAEMPILDGYMLTGAEDESREAMRQYRREVLYYGAGTALFLTLFLSLIISSVEKLRLWKRTQGVCAQVNTYVTRKGRSGETYTFTYTVAGKTYEAGRWYDMTLGTYKQGDPVTVVYSPKDPSRSMVLCFSNLWAWPIVTFLPLAFCASIVASSLYFRRIEERAAQMNL